MIARGSAIKPAICHLCGKPITIKRRDLCKAKVSFIGPGRSDSDERVHYDCGLKWWEEAWLRK